MTDGVNTPPADQLLALYRGSDGSMAIDLAAHLRHGYLITSPGFILMGRLVRKEWNEETRCNLRLSCTRESGNAWFVWAAAGDLAEILAAIPFPMDWVGWSRRDRVRWYCWEQIERWISRVDGIPS